MSGSKAKLTAIAPHFLVSDIQASADYYRDQLGFTYEWMWGEPPSFVMLTRDGLTIQLTQNRYEDRPGDTNTNSHVTGHHDMWDTSLLVDSADVAFAELTGSGARVVESPQDRYYGVREVLVADPDGYHYVYGSLITPPGDGPDGEAGEETTMAEEKAKLIRVAPVLMVSDIQASAAYYQDKLGFTYEQFWGEPPSFVMMRRDGLTIMLAEHSHDGGPGDTNPNSRVSGHEDQWDAYIWVDNVDILYEEVKAAGATIFSEPCNTFYDLREFQITDPDGYQIGFGGPIPDGADG